MKQFQNYFNEACIMAPKRNKRPFINEGDTTCPFCLANESSLSKIIDESWQADKLFIRIVPNLYPLTNAIHAPGIHDVIIDTENHLLHPKDFSISHWEILLRGMQKRWQNIMLDSKIRLIQIFKNYGTGAGASISHSHWQLVALEDIPHSLIERYKYYMSNQKDNCYLCSNVHIQEGTMVWESQLWEVWVPPVPEFPYETWLIPKKHYQHYGQLTLEEITELGKLMKYLLEVYYQLESQYAFNICFMSGDIQGEYKYHFYIKLLLRRGQIAGFELATGCHIISEAPEVYALEMKKILKGLYK